MMQNMAYGQVFRADSPILVVTPHTGSGIPDELLVHPAWRDVLGRVADPAGLALRSAAQTCGVSCISALHHPCVIDLNLPSDDRALRRRIDHNALCRTHTARGEPLYEPGREPRDEELEARVDNYWRPFHAAVASELGRLRKQHDNVLLLVSHASFWLSPFRDQPGASDCNIGTHRGVSCDRQLVSALTAQVKAYGRSWVVNGRIADTFAAQHYGAPESGIHAMEIEIAARWRADVERQRRLGAENAEPDTAFASALRALEDALRKLPPAHRISHLAMQAGGGAD